MRPLQLEMTAFGSYAGPVTVPFEALTHGLYLVTGDTGAGKTTIFDAIMFALYGTASGTDRTPDKMHCDYVSKSQDAIVTLTFLQDGREYKVQRSIHFPKKRGGEGEYGDGSVNALLWAPGAEPLEGAQKVTDRCTRLLGLNADQFRKIVMLAQGEFREFLKADSDKKNEILGKLFDNSACVYYQELLAGARDELARRRAAQQEKLARTMEETFQMPAGLPPEEAVLYLPGHPALAENLAALIAGEEAGLQALEAGRGAAQRALDKLNEEKGRAEGLNAQLAQLEAARARQKELEALRPAMEERAGAAARAARALRGVKPAAARLARAKQEEEKTRQELETLAAALARQEEALAAAREKSEAAAPLEAEAAGLAAALAGLEKQLPRYAALTQKAGEEAAARQARQAEEAKAAAAAREEEAESRRLEALRRELQALEGAEAEFVKREGESEAAQTRWLALAGKGGIRAEAAALLKEEAETEKVAGALAAAARLAADAEEDHHRLYRRFVEGQAGLLAQDLRRRLAEEGAAPCPVCGTPHTRGQEDAFAPLPQNTPTREEVDRAKACFDKAEKARQGQDAALRARTAALAARKEALCARAAALPLDAQSWAGLTAPGFLAGEEARLQSEMESCAAALKAAGARKARREACAAEVTAAGEKLEALAAARQAHSRRAEEQNALCLAAAAAGEEIRRGLDFDSEAEARTRMKALAQKKAGLEEELKALRKALEAARQARDTTAGSLSEKKGLLADRAAALAGEEKALDQAVAKAGFAGRKEADAALALIPGDKDGEAWLAEEEAARSGYENALSGTAARVSELEKLTAGRPRADMAALEEQLSAAAESWQKANAQWAGRNALLENHRRTAAAARECLAGLEASRPAWQRLEKLGSLAAGAAGAGGKLSFDRYVMGAVFREVLEMANRRLDIMSGGKYELIHKTDAERKNAKAGLEIEVLDISTGRQRPSGTLSGGEAFFTSLALALGLSDVVQNHAGGKKLDALFIDEGFGTLSDGVLDKALEVLNQLTEGDRLVGIISHVDKLDESIPQKIRVRHTEKGSSLSVEVG